MAILFQCGFLGTPDEPEIKDLIDALSPLGVVKAITLPGQDSEARRLSSDLSDAVASLVAMATLASSPVILSGQSLGATVALLAAAELARQNQPPAAVLCFSPILSPREWFSEEKYQRISSHEHEVIVSRRGRTTTVTQRFVKSLEENPLDNDAHWAAPLVAAQVPVAVCLGLSDPHCQDDFVARLRCALPQCEVSFEPASRHHFRGAALRSVVQEVSRALEARPAYSLFFDWDNTLCDAKASIDKEKIIADVCRELFGDHSLDTGRAISEGLHWRTSLLQSAQRIHGKELSSQMRLDLCARFLQRHIEALRSAHQTSAGQALYSHSLPLLDSLYKEKVPCLVTSNTMLEEIRAEVSFAGLSSLLRGVYGYPVSKLQALERVATTPEARASCILIDDSFTEISRVRDEGYATLWLQERPESAEALHQKINDSLNATTPIDPQRIARLFLGEDAQVLGRMLPRFGQQRAWKLWRGETYYLKLLSCSLHEAEQIAALLSQLRSAGIPVSRWCEASGAHAHPITARLCAVVEPALIGEPLPREAHTDLYGGAVARHLALFHSVTAKCSTLKREIPNALSSFSMQCERAWRLAEYARFCCTYAEPTESLRQFDAQSEDILSQLDALREPIAKISSASPQIILGDCNASNFLFDASGQLSGLIDFEDLHMGPRELDLVSYCLFGERELREPSDLEEVLSIYNSSTENPLRLEDLVTVAKAVSLLQKIRAVASTPPGATNARGSSM